MGEHHYSTAILAAFGGFAGGFCAYLLTGYALTEAQWCIAGEEHCLRNWIGALSGWAAAGAAAATILFLRFENRRRELLDWRDIVNSAELLRGKLEPQLNLLLGAVRHEHNIDTPKWVVPCLERIQKAISDPENQEFRKASVGVAAFRDVALRMSGQSIEFAQSCLEWQRLPNETEMQFLRITHEQIERLVAELDRIVSSAWSPRDYRGL